MDDKPTRLFLVRHAETEWNTAQLFQGHLDSALTARGLQQATELAERLSTEPLVAVYSSDQGRALRTAETVAGRLGLTAIPTPELREIDCGEWTGKGYQEVRSLWPEHFSSWESHPERHQMPSGESIAQVQERALRFLCEVQRRHPGQAVCAITHNTDVRTILCHLRGWPLARLWDGERQPNCSINLIEFVKGRADLLEVSNTSHLTSVGASGTTSVI